MTIADSALVCSLERLSSLRVCLMWFSSAVKGVEGGEDSAVSFALAGKMVVRKRKIIHRRFVITGIELPG